MFKFLKKENYAVPFIGSLMDRNSKLQQNVELKFSLHKLSYSKSKVLIIDLVLADKELKKLNFKKEEWIVVKVTTQLRTGVIISLQLSDWSTDNPPTLDSTEYHKGSDITYTAIPFSIFCNKSWRTSKALKTIIEIEELDKIFKDSKQSLSIRRNPKRKAEPFKTYDNICFNIERYLVYIKDFISKKLNKDWITSCTELSDGLIRNIEILKNLKSNADNILEVPESIPTLQTLFEPRDPNYSLKGSKRGTRQLKGKNVPGTEDIPTFPKIALEPINILLIGAKSSGKTTLINSLRNYLEYLELENIEEPLTDIPSEFFITDTQNKKAIIKCGIGKLESPYQVVDVQYKSIIYRLMDTPGVSCEENKEDYFARLKIFTNNTNIHVVCFVINANENNFYNFKETVSLLPQILTISQNIFLIVTNSSLNSYKNSLRHFQNYVSELNLKLATNSNNLFLVDNDAYRYLCARKCVKFPDSEKRAFIRHWDTSSKELKRWLGNIQSLIMGDSSERSRRTARGTGSVVSTSSQRSAPQLIKQPTLTILLVGSDGCGKTSFFEMISKHFPGKFINPATYVFSYENHEYKLIDSKDYHNQDKYLLELEHATMGIKINVILYFITMTESITDNDKQSIFNIISSVKRISEEVAFCFTGSKGKENAFIKLLKENINISKLPAIIDKERQFYIEGTFQMNEEIKRLFQFCANPPPLKQTTARPTEKSKQCINVLVLGPTKSGKSSFINSVANHLKYAKLSDAEKKVLSPICCEFRISSADDRRVSRISTGVDPPSRGFNIFSCEDHDVSYNIIDTPGIKSKMSSDEYFNIIFNYVKDEKIDFICLVFNINESRAKPCVLNFIHTIPLLTEISQRLVYCFTHSASNHFQQPGRTLDIITAEFQSYNSSLRLNHDQVFFIDNEPFRYLCSLNELKYTQTERNKYSRIWDMTHSEIINMFKYFIKTPALACTNAEVAEKEVNIMIIGQTGIGKTTFINSLINYMNFKSLDEALGQVLTPLPFTFTLSIGTNESLVVRCGGSGSEHSCQFQYEGCKLRFHDVSEKSLMSDKSFDNMDAICVLLKPNESIFQPKLLEMLNHISEIGKNIMFCFTRTSSTKFKPGDTLSLLLKHFQCNKNVLLDMDHLYSFENESFTYLHTYNKVFYEDYDKNKFHESYDHSKNEARRLLQNISKIHCPIDTHVNDVKKRFKTMSKSILTEVKELAELVVTANKLESQLQVAECGHDKVVKSIEANIQIDPLYFCINETCPNFCSKGKDKSVWKFDVLKSQHCHLSSSTLNECSSCRCHIKYHILVESVTFKEDVEIKLPISVDPNAQADYQKIIEKINNIRLHNRNTIDEIAGLSLFLKTLYNSKFEDYFKEKIVFLIDTTNDNTFKDELIHIHKYYEDKLCVMRVQQCLKASVSSY